MQSMASYIGFAGIGDLSTGSPVQDHFAVGMMLFVITFVLNIDQHAGRAAVPGGLRMSVVITGTRRARPRRSWPRRCRTPPDPGRAFRVFLLVSLGSSPSARSDVDLVDHLPRGPTTAQQGPDHQHAVRSTRAAPASSRAILGSIWVVGADGAVRPCRWASAPPSTSRSSLKGPVVQPAGRAQHPEPRCGALDRLRNPRAGVHRSRSA